MERCWLKGSEGDPLHAVLCAAGFSIRWLLRAIARLGLAGLFFVLAALSLLHSRTAAPSLTFPSRSTLRLRPHQPSTEFA